MAISINWITKVISIPQAYMSFVSGTLYELDVETLRTDLKAIEAGVEGMPFLDTHSRNAPTTLSGITYAQTFSIINNYTVTFENTGSHYTVRFAGANHNIADVTNFELVNLVIGNSAGLIEVDTGGGGSGATAAEIATAVVNKTTSGAAAGSIGDGINKTLKKSDYIALG